MKTIGIKLADGTFYPVLEEGTPKKRMLDLTTAKDNQTKVQIDLYRSENGTMEDAEYVDTLEVTKLNPHPNGEPELHLSVGLDENNNLTAEVVDPETGKKSETEVSLVSRTEAERAEPADFEITGTGDAAEDVTVADESNGILADEHVTTDIEETTFSPEELPDMGSSALEDVPFSFDRSTAAESTAEAPVPEGVDGELPDFSELDTEVPVEDKTLESVDFSDKTEPEAEPKSADEFSTEDFALPDFDTNSTDTDTAAGEDTTVAEESDFSSDLDKDFTADLTSDLPDFDDDFGATSFDDTTVASDSTDSFDSTEPSGFDIPDFDAPSTDSDPFASSSDTTATGLNFDDLDDPAFNLTSESSASSGSAMDFSDLYDKETIAGEHASLYDEEEEKKTRTPVIICIICAIICVIATILLLFVVPSKYNLLASRNTNGVSLLDKFFHKETAIEKPVEQPKEEPKVIDVVVEEPKNEAPEAVEDKIVIAPEPEKVVPKPAPVEEKKPEIKKTSDVKYHIKWGDTLWDLSESYYKTPWKYPKIADYNKIKNPDLIISGTDIMIPAE